MSCILHGDYQIGNEMKTSELKQLIKEEIKKSLKEDEQDDIADIKKAFKKAGLFVNNITLIPDERYKVIYPTFGRLFSIIALNNLEKSLQQITDYGLEGIVPSRIKEMTFYLRPKVQLQNKEV